MLTALALVQLIAWEGIAQESDCKPGLETLVAASDVVVRAQPLSARLERRDGMYYLRGEYRVLDRARGGAPAPEPGEVTVIVEFSCIDMVRPGSGPATDFGHCPNAEGIGLPGFMGADDRWAPSGPRPLFLSRAAASPLDGATVYGVVDRRPFTSCLDGPQKFESAQDEWQYVLDAEKAERPSSPVADYERKVAQKKAAEPTGGCR